MQKKILVIDDEPKIVKVLINRLTIHGFNTASANDGESGFEKARKFLPDVILLDMMMSGLSGLETANRLRDNPGTSDIPIIFLTGLDSESIDRQLLEKGHSHVLLKPFQVGELLTILSNDFGM